MTEKPVAIQANHPNTTTGSLAVPADVVTQAVAAVAEIKESLKDSMKKSMADVGREHSGQLLPPLTPRHFRRYRPRF